MYKIYILKSNGVEKLDSGKHPLIYQFLNDKWEEITNELMMMSSMNINSVPSFTFNKDDWSKISKETGVSEKEIKLAVNSTENIFLKIYCLE